MENKSNSNIYLQLKHKLLVSIFTITGFTQILGDSIPVRHNEGLRLLSAPWKLHLVHRDRTLD